MNNEYVIINKTELLKMMEETNNDIDDYYGHKTLLRQILKHILSQSTPLIPEIEKAYTAGMEFIGEDKGSPNEYISNLKLDI